MITYCRQWGNINMSIMKMEPCLQTGTENNPSPIAPIKIIKSTWRHSIMTNNPTKYESNPISSYRGVAVTRILTENSLSPITPTKIIKSTWRHSMHIYTSWPTILLNMKAIRRAVTEEKPWQEQDWRTDGQMDGSKTLYPSQLRCVGYNYLAQEPQHA